MTRFLYDTSVFVYARGSEHEYREPCRAIVRLAERGLLAGEASVELVQEYAYLLRRRGVSGQQVWKQSRDVMSLATLHEFGEEDLQRALSLLATHPALGARDAVHAATALSRGIPVVVSADRAFDEVGGLERVDPRDVPTRLASS